MSANVDIGSRRRADRKAHFLFQFILSAIAVLIGIPATLLVLNGMLGWRAAVLAMPATLILAVVWSRVRRRRTRGAEPDESPQADKRRLNIGFRLALGIGTLGVPLYAVTTDQMDAMRLWPPLERFPA